MELSTAQPAHGTDAAASAVELHDSGAPASTAERGVTAAAAEDSRSLLAAETEPSDRGPEGVSCQWGVGGGAAVAQQSTPGGKSEAGGSPRALQRALSDPQSPLFCALSSVPEVPPPVLQDWLTWLLGRG